MTKKNVNLINMTTDDVYSLILFALFKLKDTEEYSTLSELAYILDYDSLLNFLKYFGGTTITIPTVRDLKLAAKCLLLYQQVTVEGKDFAKAISELSVSSDYHLSEIKKMYFTLCDVMEKYTFDRGLA